jgi:hypothetical protein
MSIFIAIHKHECGTSVKVFQCYDNAESVFNHLPEHESLDEPDALTQIDFASRININFEPDKGETLEVQKFDPTKHDFIDITEFV